MTESAGSAVLRRLLPFVLGIPVFIGWLVVSGDRAGWYQAASQIAYRVNLLANINDAIVATDANFRLTAWNTAAGAMYGWKAEEVLGKTGTE